MEMTHIDLVLEVLSGGDLSWEERFLAAGVALTNAVDWLNAAMDDLNSARTELNRLLREKADEVDEQRRVLGGDESIEVTSESHST